MKYPLGLNIVPPAVQHEALPACSLLPSSPHRSQAFPGRGQRHYWSHGCGGWGLQGHWQLQGRWGRWLPYGAHICTVTPCWLVAPWHGTGGRENNIYPSSLFVCLFLCLTLFNSLFSPTSRRPISKLFRFSESLWKSNGKKWSQIWPLLLIQCAKLRQQKKFPRDFFYLYTLFKPLFVPSSQNSMFKLV